MSIRTLGSPCNQAGQVQKYLGPAYDTVKKVADHIDEVALISEMLAKYGVLLCFTSAEELATVDPKLATFARIYDTSDTMNLYFKDYVYRADSLDGLPAKGGVGAWVEMDGISEVFGSMAWIYNKGSAAGGETALTLDIDTLSVTDLYVNGAYKTYGLDFTFNPATQVITLNTALAEKDVVVAKLSGVPALPPDTSVDNFRFLNFVYNEGAARGGETVIATGIPFLNISSVFKNGERLLFKKDFTYSAVTHTITFTTALTRGDVVQATLGGNLDTMSEAAGYMASQVVKYYHDAKDLIDAFGLAVSDAKGYAEDSAASEKKATAAATSAASDAISTADDRTAAAASATAAAASEQSAATSLAASQVIETKVTAAQKEIQGNVDQLNGEIESVEERVYTDLKAAAGFGKVGQVASWAALQALTPTAAGDRILLASWNAGSHYGGGEFIALSGTATDDGGVICVPTGSTTFYWQRLGDLNNLNVCHFGAIPDNSTDCAPAVTAMAAWSLAQSGQGTRIGVHFPAGNFAMSNFAYTTYVSYFRMTGSLSSFGYFAATKLKLIGAADSWAFTVQARWCEVSAIDFYGQYDSDSVVRNFFQNTVAGGAYFHAHCWHATQMGGKCFFLYDTLDTKFSEFYTNYTYDSVIYNIMSGTAAGAWDHTTAVELANFNIQYHLSTSAAAGALFIPRSTQSIIWNGWIEHSTYPGNISEGEWILDRFSIESTTYPLLAQYCRIQERGTNINGNAAGLDYDNGAVGTLNGVATPSWATSVYEQGRSKLMNYGLELRGSLASQYQNSLYRMTNMTNATAWYYVGTIVLPATGASCALRILGGRGFDAASASPNMIGTTYGGGEAIIRIQNKADTSKASVTWHGRDATPILKVKYVQTSTTTVQLYVQMGAYTYAGGVFLDTDSTSRFQAGLHFYWQPSIAVVSDITTVASTVDANSTISFNNGTYGFGMELTNGVMASTAALTATGNMNFLPWRNNGTLYQIPLFTTVGIALPNYYKSALPDATTNKYKKIFVIDTAKTPALQECYSNGTNWVYSIDPATTVA